MLAKKKAERRQAVAAAERTGDALRGKRPRGETPTVAEDPAAVLRAIGDHVNTRLQELEFDDDLDADLFDEQQRQLREEAALAAGTKSRVLAPQIAAFLQQQQEQEQTTSKKDKGGRDIIDSASSVGVKMVRVGHNSNAVTAVCSFGSNLVVLGDKSGAVYVAELNCSSSPGQEQQKQQNSVTSQKSLLSPYLPAAVLTIAVSDTRGIRPSQRALFERSTVDTSVTSYIAAGAADGTISVWVTSTRKHMGFLTMHHGAVTGLTFRHDTLYSCSNDETLRVWSVPQMICEDKLFGHQGRILGIHCLKRERCATVGEDGAMRYWKVDAATQQEFAASVHFGVKVVLECVAMMNDNIVICGAANGALLVFDVNRRKPIAVREAAHGYGFTGDGTGLEKVEIEENQKENDERREGNAHQQQEKQEQKHRRQNPNPITAVAALPYSDVAASASYDGVVRIWRLTTPDGTKKTEKSTNDAAGISSTTKFECLASIPVDAIVTSLYFSLTSDVLLIGCSKEPRLGRWVVKRSALNAAYVVPLNENTLREFATCTSVEHIPAELYGFNDDEDADEPTDSVLSDAGADATANRSMESSTSIQSDDISLPENSNDDDDDDAGLFTIGEDGQMQFNAPQEENDSQVKKKKNKKSNINSSTAGKGKKERPLKGAKKIKTSDKKRQVKSEGIVKKKKKKN
ncbi:putative WD40 repeat protein [Trypanosoma theileri]|uniref:Putative WD40 repeat protein n=1 Tax=Trypanosoma theileri TaxID=67003 RepID=A0A1X0P8I5_9TRYP|nr:putative WD40 repeat protein [Trypanosoma theileri]ORC93254.1 putative WD40 repeat protein [Trypanosoma theileri]